MRGICGLDSREEEIWVASDCDEGEERRVGCYGGFRIRDLFNGLHILSTLRTELKELRAKDQESAARSSWTVRNAMPRRLLGLFRGANDDLYMYFSSLGVMKKKLVSRRHRLNLSVCGLSESIRDKYTDARIMES